jgi:Uma2 family endonuclease
MPILLTTPSENDKLIGFTVKDVRAMIAAGILDVDEKFELPDGELVPMQAHNPAHLRLKRWLLKTLSYGLNKTHWVDSEPSLYLDGFKRGRSFTAPDLIVYPRRFSPEDVRGADCDLLIEVASATQRKDLGRKAKLYAQHGVRDYWVCDTDAKLTYIHRSGVDGVYPAPVAVGFEQPVTALLPPDIALRMTDAP